MGEFQFVGVIIVFYDVQDQVYLDIKFGCLDGIVVDVVEVNGGFLFILDGKDYFCVGGCVLVEFEKYFGVGVGVVICKEDMVLCDVLDVGIKVICDNGKWKEFVEKYVFGVDIWGF